MPLGWKLTGNAGVTALLHEEGPYEESEGGLLRAALYPRLRTHLGFINEHRLFPDVHHEKRYSINIYGQPRQRVTFDHIGNLFVPATVDASYDHDGSGEVGGVKTAEGKWNTIGHRERIVRVNEDILAVFANLYDESGTPPLRARLPAMHAEGLASALKKLSEYPRRLSALGEADRFNTPSTCWHESGAQKNGTIKADTGWPDAPTHLIFTGSIFNVGAPFHKTPRRVCTQPNDYDCVDLAELPDGFLPRSVYAPAVSQGIYRSRAPVVGWADSEDGRKKSVLDFYRHANREMVGPSRERTLICAIIPPGTAHVHAVLSNAFRTHGDLLDYHSFCLSLPVDYLVKTTGTAHANPSLIAQLPMLVPEAPAEVRDALHLRALVLNCVTKHYSGLWNDSFRGDVLGFL
jgi:hypothetical protein